MNKASMSLEASLAFGVTARVTAEDAKAISKAKSWEDADLRRLGLDRMPAGNSPLTGTYRGSESDGDDTEVPEADFDFLIVAVK